MTNIFTILKDVFQTKSGNLSDELDFNESFNPYIFQRWITMESTESAHIANETTNKIWNGLEDNQEMWYKLYITLIKKRNFKKIPYIKRAKMVTNEKKDLEIAQLAKQHNISQREVKEYLNMIESHEKGE